MIFSLIIILLFTNSQPYISFAAPFQKGDIFASVDDGRVQHYNPSGELLETLDTGKGSGIFTAGCGFDSAGNLYVTTFNGGDVIVFSGPDDPHTNLGAFGSEYSGYPESIVLSFVIEDFVEF